MNFNFEFYLGRSTVFLCLWTHRRTDREKSYNNFKYELHNLLV